MTGTLIDLVYWQPMQNVGLLKTTINEYMGVVYRVSSTVRGRHLNDNEINFLFGANHPVALGTHLVIFVHGGTWAISS